MVDNNVQVLKRVIDQALKPIIKRLDDPKTGLGAINKRLDSVDSRLDDPKTGLIRINQKLDAVWEQTASLTEDMAEVKETQSSHTSALKEIKAKIDGDSSIIWKLNKRVVVLEENSGIVPPAEYIVV